MYPALHIPARINDLVAVERGDKIEIYFTIPSLTTEGLVVRGIAALELRVGPNPNSANVNQWAGTATRIDVPMPWLPGPVHASLPVRDFIGKEVDLAVRAGNLKNRMSEWSNVYVLPVEEPLEKPADFEAKPSPEGVQLTWKAANENAFRIFRKVDAERTPSLLAASDKPEYMDTSTEYGKSYEYYVQGVHEKTESDVAGPAAITPKDIFPPAVPTGLTASAGVGTIELAWQRNTEPDFKAYRVYRAEGGGPFVQIADGVEAPAYSDQRIESGKRYRYQVSAVDQTGNPSEPSQPVEIIAP